MHPDTGSDPIRVVIVDDHADFRMMLRLVIDSHPRFSVVGEARDGREAIDVTGTEKPDIVLLDISMPHVDGLQALPAVIEAAPKARVVMLSGLPAQHLRVAASSLGAHSYLEKGFQTAEFLQVLEEQARELQRSRVRES